MAHSEDKWVTNFPKPHSVRGTVKNLTRQTNGWFNPNIRMFKTLETGLWAVAKSVDLAPSYFIEYLLYNVPNELFFENVLILSQVLLSG